MSKTNTTKQMAGQGNMQGPYNNSRLIYLLNITRITGVVLICLLLFMLTRGLLLIGGSAH